MPLSYPTFDTRRADQFTIAAETWRWDGTSGSVLVCSGFPLQAGQVTPTNVTQVRVYVGGVEQAVAVHPLDGKFPDGSYRSLGLQFQYTLTHNTPVAAEVKINHGPRGTTDRTWVDPTYAGHLRNKAVIAPTDPVHLCATLVTLMPLIPASNDTGPAVAWATFLAAEWTGTTTNGQRTGSAMYSHQQGLFAQWCRTGNRAFYQAAYDWSVEPLDSAIISAPLAGGGASQLLLLPYANATQPGDPNYGVCTNSAYYNPEGLHGNNGCGFGPSEAYAIRVLAMAPAYWITAWHQFKRTMNMFAQEAMRLCATGYTAQRDRWFSDIWGPRMNHGVRGMTAMIAAYLTECTTSFAMQGTSPQASWDYATFLLWTLNSHEDYEWNLGDYRDGLVGWKDTVLGSAGEVYGINLFQLIVVTEFLMAYYDHVAPDARIPVWMKRIADFIITQIRASLPTDPGYPAGQGGVLWVTPYYNMDPASIPASTFTANTVAGSTTMTWTGGPASADPATLISLNFVGPGLISGTHAMSVSGTTITLNNAATTPNTNATYTIQMNAWTLAMFPTIFAWVYAYTGDPVYRTWAERAAVPGNMGNITRPLETKQWGEHWGGTRMAFFYYYAGGQIRATPKAHPAAITNPPLHPDLG